jgi:hypothetical protein
MNADRKLPGIRFDAHAGGQPGQLPRMDVAAFVGFAASGPLNTPVPVDDPRTFREIFGDDLPLAWNPVNGSVHRAYLGPAVRAFFRCGGRRCWVVRVAGQSAAANRFPIPQLTAVTPDGTLRTVAFQARSEGAWSDGLLVAPVLNLAPLGPAGLIVLDQARAAVTLSEVSTSAPAVGDLLRLRCGGRHRHVLVYLAVDRPSSAGRDGRPPTVEGRCYAFDWDAMQAEEPAPLQPLDLMALPRELATTAALATFTLWVNAGGQMYRVENLGFTSEHPRFAGYLPSDAALFADPTLWEPRGDGPIPGSALWPEVHTPRFPLAGSESYTGGQLFLPIGMAPTLQRDRMARAVAPGTAARRNGLERFHHSYFVDGELAGVTPDQLPAAIAGKVEKLQQERLLHPERPLRWLGGIHALFLREEVTLAALPDAVQTRWKQRDTTAEHLLELTGEDGPPPKGLLSLHGALLRLCQARADLLAVLTLPAAARDRDAVDHVRRLVAAATPDATAGLGFGALYYPWLNVRDGPSVRCYPPDGTVIGTIAAQSLTFGAWTAPANVPLPGVASVEPPIPPNVWANLVSAGVNAVTRSSHICHLLSADTLSLRPEYRPIGVRLLLIFLRKLLMIQGARLAFAANTDGFRQVAQVQIQALLSQLFAQGALAGDSPSDAYQVIVDPVDSTQPALEDGRIVIDILIAPARPLTFITVRLISAGGGPVQIVEG